MNSRHPDPRRMWKWGWRGTFWTTSEKQIPRANSEANSEGKLRTKLRTKLSLFSKTEAFVFLHIAEISARYHRQNDRTDLAHLFCVQKIHKKHNLDSFFQGAFFGEVFAQQGRARGPGARGPYGPWPIWALAHMGYVPDF